MPGEDWVSLGAASELAKRELQQLQARDTPIALCYRDGTFTALSGVCNHVGGPLGDGMLDGDYVTCPWHFWKFHYQTGRTRPEIGDGSVPTYRVKVEAGEVFVDLASATRAQAHPASAASAGPAGEARAGADPRGGHFDHDDEPAVSAAEHVGAAAGTRPSQQAAVARLRDPIDSPARAELPPLRRLSTPRARTPAPGPVRSRRWIRPTSSIASTKRSCIGPTRS